MKITSMDINNKEFKKIIRGYDCDDVDEFLDQVAEDYETVYKENSSLKERIIALEEKMQQYTKIETTLQNTLILAQNTAEQYKLNTQKESEMMIDSAKSTAQRIIEKAKNDSIKLNSENDSIKQDYIKFKAKFRNFMNTQMETFDSLEENFNSNNEVLALEEENKVEGKEIETNIAVTETKNLTKILDEEIPEDDSLENIKNFFLNDGN